MEEKLTELLGTLNSFLESAPEEADCEDDENEMYADMANLGCSINAYLQRREDVS